MQFRKAVRTKLKARMAIDGPSGAGKTYTSLIAASVFAGVDGHIAVIDTERGSASLYADQFTFDVLELDHFDPLHYVEAIQAAQQSGYEVL
ncbi:MAG: ATP-binding protein, partial [Anaerolineaceae bacterium]|nr:ATP-binding protein [Anaerolineaceae bacterium]